MHAAGKIFVGIYLNSFRNEFLQYVICHQDRDRDRKGKGKIQFFDITRHPAEGRFWKLQF